MKMPRMMKKKKMKGRKKWKMMIMMKRVNNQKPQLRNQRTKSEIIFSTYVNRLILIINIKLIRKFKSHSKVLLIKK